MVKKRKSRGRHKGKGKKGRAGYVYCSNCGARIPRDKAIRRVMWISPVDPQLSEELKKQGAIILKQPLTKYYCVSCAVHYGIVRIGMSAERAAKES